MKKSGQQEKEKLFSEWFLERRTLVLPANGVSGSARGLTQFSELLVLLPQSLHRHVVEPRAAGHDGLQFFGKLGRLLHRHRHGRCHDDQPGQHQQAQLRRRRGKEVRVGKVRRGQGGISGRLYEVRGTLRKVTRGQGTLKLKHGRLETGETMRGQKNMGVR